MRIAIVDYGMGNLRSVYRAFEYAGAKPVITSSVEEIEASDALILPGVGAFEDAMANLLPLRKVIIDSARKKPILGICLGLQLFFSESEESRLGENGLGIIKGKVVRLPENLKIPHIGWNSIEIKKKSRILEGIKHGGYFYFVHSYYAVPQEDVVVATTDYSVDVPAILEKDSVFATQFHPEKSGKAGLRIIKNFVEIVRE